MKMRKACVLFSLQNSNFWIFSSNPPSKPECLNFKLSMLDIKGQELVVNIK